jgi:TonB-dependent receptor
MLDGIEVTKVVMPDQDPDVLGGSVNFRMREAKAGEPGVGLEVLTQGGYNGLSNAHNRSNNYKVVVGSEGRFLEERLGIFAQAEVERRNLTSDEVGATFDNSGKSQTLYLTRALNLNHIPRDRIRANGSLNVDFGLSEGKVSLMNLLSSGTTSAQSRGEVLDIQGNSHTYSLSSTRSTLNMLTNALTVEHPLAFLRLKAMISHTYSETASPNDWIVSFIQTSAGLNQFAGQTNINPQAIPIASNNNLAATELTGFTNTHSFSKERAWTAALDFETDLSWGDLLVVTFKTGGKRRHQTRLYQFEQFNNNASFSSSSARIATNLIAGHFPATQSYVGAGSIPITPFLDPSFSYGTFLNGDYRMSVPLNYGMMAELARFMEEQAGVITQQQPEGYARNNLASTTNNYSGEEDQTGGYLMATLQIGEDLTIIPGIRYQDLRTSYSAPQGFQSALSYYAYNHLDTTVTQDHAYWLPALILRYKPLTWFDLRLSYTNALAYPDYNAIVPRIDVSSSGFIAWNNSRLVPSRSRNYDAYASFYHNAIGLLTVGGFLKEIDNLIYGWSFYVTNQEVLPYLPAGLTTSFTPIGTYQIGTYVNDPYRIRDWGIEVDWQTHFWYLPRPLDGLVFSINYSRLMSQAEYPYTDNQRVGRQIVYIDTSFVDRLLFQPDNIVNLSIGYDYEGFSLRVSMLYQDDVFTGPNYWPQLRTTTAAYRRWDVSLKQTLPWFGLQVYGEFNNLNGAKDVRLIRGSGYPQSQQSYGPTMTLGLRSRL